MIPTRDIVILVIIAVISTAIARGCSDYRSQETMQGSKLLAEDSMLNFGSVQTISIQRNGELLEFNHVNGEWWQVIPFSLRMDSASMRAIIRSVQGAQVLGELPEATNVVCCWLGERLKLDSVV